MELLNAPKPGLFHRDYIAGDSLLLLKLLELIDIHFKEHRDPEFYSARLSVTLWVLNPLCKYHYRKTVHRLITVRVLQEALFLLRYTRLSSKQVAFELGFTDPCYFSRFFLRETGRRPGQYRKDILLRD